MRKELLRITPYSLPLAFYGYSHASRRSRKHLGGGIEIEGVQILNFFLRKLLALGHGQLANFVLVGFSAAFFGLHGILENDAGRRAFDFEAEGAVFVNRDDHADDFA